MKPIIIYSDKFLNAISWFFPVGGISLFPFIILRRKLKGSNSRLADIVINHETIHFQQAVELLFVGFYILYLLNFLVNLIRYRNVDKAYETILFEKEAYGNENNLEYLKTRKRFAWIK